MKLATSVINDYNPDGSYIYKAIKLSNNIHDKYFEEPQDYLTPLYKGEKYNYSDGNEK